MLNARNILQRSLPILRILGLSALASCALRQPNGYVDATAWSANYTEDYIPEFKLETKDGKDLLLLGVQVAEFSKGGKGGGECCSPIPGVGQTIKVVWYVGDRQDDRDKWKSYSRDVVVKGVMPKITKDHSVLVMRFFPQHQVEAELFAGDGVFGPENPRMDKIFFVGPRAMRKMRE